MPICKRTVIILARRVHIAISEVLNHNTRKLSLNFTSQPMYQIIAKCCSYDDALRTLEPIYIQTKNKIFCRRLPTTKCKNIVCETNDSFGNYAVTQKTPTLRLSPPLKIAMRPGVMHSFIAAPISKVNRNGRFEKQTLYYFPHY